MQSSENILAQTAPPKVLAVPSSSRFGKDTKIGHFLKFFKGGTKGKSQKKEADFGGSKIASAQTALLLINIRLKCNHRRTFWRKPRLQKCSQCRVLADLAKTPKSAIFWNSSKGGPRENRKKRRPTSGALKSPWRKRRYLLITIRLKCNHRRTFWRKPRLQKCLQCGVLADLAKTPKSAIFWNSSKGDQGKIAKKGGRLRGLENLLGPNGATSN